MTEVEATLVGALVGGVIGGVGTYWGAVKIARKQEFNKAATAFRDAFLPERFQLDIRHVTEEHEDKTAMQIIEPAIQRHTEAMLRFSYYLPWWQRRRFTNAWDTYIHYKIDGDPTDKPFAAMYAEDKWEGNSSKELAIKRIDKLLSFAKQK